jgi:hypothetical protein
VVKWETIPPLIAASGVPKVKLKTIKQALPGDTPDYHKKIVFNKSKVMLSSP